MADDILIAVFPLSGTVPSRDLAAIGFGLQSAEISGGACDVLLIGGGAADAESVAKLGARCVYTADHEQLRELTAEAASHVIRVVAIGRSYRMIGAATSSLTRDALPRVAVSLDAPMASDVLSIDALEKERAEFTRAVFVGNLHASFELEGDTCVATCRGSAFEAPSETDTVSAVEALTIDGPIGHARKRFVESRMTVSDRLDLSEASTVVSVGRGTRGPEEGIPIVEELADLLGAALGATRAVVDAGWLPNDLQVGQTGKIVAPNLYIAIGMSGAIQHLAGMRNSKTIVAINRDAEAPIFDIADIGLVADLFEAVPELIREFRGSG